MIDEIRRDDLQALEACDEGLQWFDGVWPGGQTAGERGLERLVAEDRRDYLAWIGFRFPHLRRLADEALRRAVLGPRHAALFNLHDGLTSFRWLQGRPEVGGAVQSAVDAHARALVEIGFRTRQLFAPVASLSLEGAWAEAAPLGSPEPSSEGGEPAGWGGQWRAAFLGAQAGVGPSRLRALVEVAALDEPAGGVGEPAADEAIVARRRAREWLERSLEPVAAVAQQVRQAVGDGTYREVLSAARDRFERAAATDPAWRRAALVLDEVRGESDNLAKAVFWGASAVASSARADVCGHALWLFVDAGARDPFEPLVRLWRLGLWPVGFTDAGFVLGASEASAG